MAHIIAVDDDADLRALLKTALERDGHQVTVLSSGGEIGEKHCRWADCILLDVMMPGEDGFAACRRIREMADCPILFLTAKTGEADVITGLGLGGDDYLTKPFRLAELRARVNAHLRRQTRTPHSRLRRGELDFDLAGQAVFCREQPVRLTRSEFAICQHLALRPGQTFTKEQLYHQVWNEYVVDDNTIMVYIKRLREKIEDDSKKPSYLKTVRGIGYLFDGKT